MPSNKMPIKVYVEDERKQALIRRAEQAGYKSVSAYVDDILTEYFESKNEPLPENDTAWGGNRST